MVQLSLAAAEKLNSLLGEINTLATQCKQARPPFQTNGDGAGGVRGVLLVLGRSGGQTVPEIARVRSTSRQNIQIVVNRLKAEGLAECTTNPTHRRSALVRLTEKGRQMFRQLEMAEAKLLDDVLVELSQEELVSATKCLQRLRQALAAEPRHPGDAATKAPSQHHKRTVGRTNQPTVPTAGLDQESTPDNDDFPVNLL